MRAIGYFRTRANRDTTEEPMANFQEYCDMNLHQAFKMFDETCCETFEEKLDGSALEYKRMLNFMKQSGSNFLVVIPEAIHLGEDLESVARAMVELEEIGAKVTCMDDDLPDPLQNALYTIGVKGVSRTRSDRIKESMRARALKGQGLGRPPYGYRNSDGGRLQIVPEEAPVVELIFRLYTKENMGLRTITGEINQRGILTRRGGRWNMVTIRGMLRNSVYTGTYTRFGFRLPKTHDPIIPGDVFRSAQDKMQSRKPVGRINRSEPFLLSGLAICGYCDNKMMGVTRRQTWRKKDSRRVSGVYRYYQCQTRNNQSVCGYHTWRASLLESNVMSQIKRTLQLDDRQATSNTDVNDIQVKNAQRRFMQALKKVAAGKLMVSRLKPYLHDLKLARDVIVGCGRPDGLEDTLRDWETLAINEKQAFLANYVKRIVVKDEDVEVVL